MNPSPPTLLDQIQEVSRRALASGHLKPIHTKVCVVPDANIPFRVYTIDQLQFKKWLKEKEESLPEEKKRNPFLPHEPEMFVTEFSETHIGLLNKFPVVENHLLMVTKEFEDQDAWLTEADFACAWHCLSEEGGLVFYNGGTAAGASQRHKHLQWVPWPKRGDELPMQTVFPGRQLGFRHCWWPRANFASKSEDEWARESLACYRSALRKLGRGKNATSADEPYNLLMTREWLWLIPRSCEHFETVSINSLGFVGAMLATNEEEKSLIHKVGPLDMLEQVGVPS